MIAHTDFTLSLSQTKTNIYKANTNDLTQGVARVVGVMYIKSTHVGTHCDTQGFARVQASGIDSSAVPSHCSAMAAHSIPPAIDALAKQAVTSSAAGHVQSLLEALKDAGIAHYQQIKCFQILTSSCNRGGYGIDPFDVQENVSDVAETKFHQNLFSGLVSDIDPSDLEDVVAFNTAQVEASGGILADVEAHKASHISYWGGHTTQGMRSVWAKMPHWDESLCIDGKLSMVRVAEKSPTYAKAITEGATYLVVPSWFLKRYEGLDDAIQSAGNVLQNVAKAENDVQMLQKVCLRVGAGVSFDVLKENFKRTRHKNIESLPHIYNFVRKFPDKELMSCSVQFIKSISKGEIRKLGPQFFDALQTDFKGPNQVPCIRFGALNGLYTQPSGTFTPGTLKALGTDANVAATISAGADLDRLATLIKVDANIAQSTQAWLAWSRLCCNVTCLLCKKDSTDVVKLLADKNQPKDYMIHMGHLMLLAVQEITESCGVKLTDEFDDHEIPELQAKKSDPVKIVHAVRVEADPTAAIMSELGFTVGDTINLVKDKDEVKCFAIEAMKDGVIKLVDVKLKKPAPPAQLADFQSKKWRVNKSKKGVWHMYKEGYAQHNANAVLQNLVKSAAALAVYAAWDSETLQSDEVKVLEGAKGVMACKHFGVGTMVLAPNSQNVNLREIKNKESPALYSNSGIYLGSSTIDGKHFMLSAGGSNMSLKRESSRNAKETLMIPFWCMETGDETTANMKLTMDLTKHIIDPCSPEVKVPLLKNHKAIKNGDRLVVLVKQPGAPALKRQKTQ